MHGFAACLGCLGAIGNKFGLRRSPKGEAQDVLNPPGAVLRCTRSFHPSNKKGPLGVSVWIGAGPAGAEWMVKAIGLLPSRWGCAALPLVPIAWAQSVNRGRFFVAPVVSTRQIKKAHLAVSLFYLKMVARGGLEPPTPAL